MTFDWQIAVALVCVAVALVLLSRQSAAILSRECERQVRLELRRMCIATEARESR